MAPASPPALSTGSTGGFDRTFTVALQDGFAWRDGGLTYGTLSESGAERGTTAKSR